MSNIKKFIDKIATMEGRSAKEIILTMNDAKLLRDEITKLLLDQRDMPQNSDTIEVVVRGNKW
jgi:hypothetical protein